MNQFNERIDDPLEALDILFTQEDDNITVALHIYTKLHDPKAEGIKRHRMNNALIMFSNYWKQNYLKIRNNMDYLSNLATIFVDELFFIEEYNQVCSAIKTYIEQSQHPPIYNSIPMDIVREI